jgi:hypothetical protein
MIFVITIVLFLVLYAAVGPLAFLAFGLLLLGE